ncbi:3-deoxy-D-manno-octulosonate 8-phosphate phosphatase (KDO 8-P phosphatase) [Parelusimicrobium proximum]|uniref:KdsC family phosphatase n=1 Tax=Parelusimicrobium proximum TaxID=3228953 RepID=UPI003D1819CB
MENISQDILKRAEKIKILITDVDGVLTDGSLNFFFTPEGKPVEVKKFYSLDGIGISALKYSGIKTAIITGGKASATEIMASALGFDFMYHGFMVKLPALEDLASKTGLDFSEMAFIGDDIIDLPVLKRVGLACVVPNRAYDLEKIGHYHTQNPGGLGAVREVAELILRAQGKWDKVLDMIENGTFSIEKKDKLALIEGPRKNIFEDKK